MGIAHPTAVVIIMELSQNKSALPKNRFKLITLHLLWDWSLVKR